MLIAVAVVPVRLSAQDAGDVVRKQKVQSELGTFRDRELPDPKRIRAVDELGRWAPDDIVSELRSGLSPRETPEMRAATLRAMMRLGVDGVREDIFAQVFNDPDVTSPELAWAIRALGRSEDAGSVVPKIIPHLKNNDVGTRAATVESLRRLTGMTMGASQANLLFPVSEQGDVDSYAKDWEQWWDENRDDNPDDWRISALSGERTVDRAAAARAIALNAQTDAIPDLIARLKKEPASGVREAIAASLAELTGIQDNKYLAYRPPEMSEKDWQAQHDEHIRMWTETWERFKEGGDPVLANLDATNPRTRLDALDYLNKRPIETQPLTEYLEKLRDKSPGVSERAWRNLKEATGVYWPFDPDAPEELRKVQIARWEEWFAEHTTSEARLLSVFRPVEHMGWGMGGASEEIRKQAKEELERAITGIRSNVARYLCRAEVKVNPTQLREAFQRELGSLREIARHRSTDGIRASTGLQRHLALAFGNLQDTEALSLLLDRIRIAQDARGRDMPREVLAMLDDPEVLAACVQSIGQFGSASIGAIDMIKDMLTGGERSVRVRAQAAIALAQLGEKSAYALLTESLWNWKEPTMQRVGAEALYILAQRRPELRDNVIDQLDRAANEAVNKRENHNDRDLRDHCLAFARDLGR